MVRIIPHEGRQLLPIRAVDNAGDDFGKDSAKMIWMQRREI